MNLEHLKTFFHVARSGSISKASELLYITQPAVSRSIKQLEDSLGCSLFFRTPKGVILTQEGEILYLHIEQAFNFIDTAERKISEVQGLLSGEVRIGVSDTLCKYYLAPYLKLFNTCHPAIKIHLVNPTTPEIIKLLKAGRIDFGIINMPVYDEQLSFKNIVEIQDCFVAGEKYKRLSYKVQPLEEIIRYPLILLEKASNTRLYMDDYFNKHSLSIVPDFELGNIDLIVHFAKNDFGIACVIKNFVQEELDKGNLYEIKLIEKIPPRNVSAVWLSNFPLTAAAKELIKYLEYNELSDI